MKAFKNMSKEELRKTIRVNSKIITDCIDGFRDIGDCRQAMIDGGIASILLTKKHKGARVW